MQSPQIPNGYFILLVLRSVAGSLHAAHWRNTGAKPLPRPDTGGAAARRPRQRHACAGNNGVAVVAPPLVSVATATYTHAP